MIAAIGHIHRRLDGGIELFVDAKGLAFRVRQE